MAKTQENQVFTPSEETLDDFGDLRFSIRVSTRYHRSRERFWDGWADLFSIVSVVSGTGAFATVLAGLPANYALALTFVVAFVQSLELVLRPGKKARLHSDLARRFLTLEQRCLEAEFDLTDRQLAELEAHKLSIDADEPPSKKWLLVHFNNELERAEHGNDTEPYVIPGLQRMIMNYRDVFDVTQAKRRTPAQ